jgi:murein DD-endopeptidase MepM/ murein hydrolase activator NlpD
MGIPKLNVNELLSRGGILSDAEMDQLCVDLSAEKLNELQQGTLEDPIDQPVKVIPADGNPNPSMSGYFTQERFLLNHTPRNIEVVLGVLGKLKNGAYVLAPTLPLLPSDYANRAYSHLPDGKPFDNPNEKVYRPGKGAPQWMLSRSICARVIAELDPDEKYRRICPPLEKMVIRVAELDKNVTFEQVTQRLKDSASPVGGMRGMVRSSGHKGHAGWDLYANIGSPAYAVTWGVVEGVLSGQNLSKDGYGNYVGLRLLSREARKLAKAKGVTYIYAFYGHLSAVQVRPGDPVWQGRVIGLTGNTGNAYNTPPHLHFELRTAFQWEKGHPLKFNIDPGELLGYGYYSTSASQNQNPYL